MREMYTYDLPQVCLCASILRNNKMVWKMIFLFQWCILRFHVNLPRCNTAWFIEIPPYQRLSDSYTTSCFLLGSPRVHVSHFCLQLKGSSFPRSVLLEEARNKKMREFWSPYQGLLPRFRHIQGVLNARNVWFLWKRNPSYHSENVSGRKL